MTKGLEALKELSDALYYCNDKELTKTHVENRLIIEKELKALEIIKRTAMKLVSLEDDTTICKKGRYAFYDGELYQSVDLTKEEYDLLKEVLL